MAKAGAKRREGVRRYQKSGAIVRADRGERPDKIIAVALAQPHRRGNQSPMAGYAFGRLFLGGMIDQRQFDAAETFTRRAVRYHAVITSSLPRFPSVAAEMVASSTGSGADLDDETIARIRSDKGELQDALADVGMHYDGNAVLMRVCVMDRDIEGDAAMGAFRCALNIIANRMRM